MALKYTENSDVIDNCNPLNESFFKEIFNVKIWQWYKEWGLISNDKPRDYMHVVNGKLMFDDEVEKGLQENKGFFGKLFSGAKFSFNIISELEKYNPQDIEQLYFYSSEHNYSHLSKEEIKNEFEKLWDLLVDNFRYAILFSLAVQYKLKIAVKEEYKKDIVAERINSIIDLNEGAISKEQFDLKFGFASEQDYDFSSPRYYEQSKIKCTVSERMSEKPGVQNFREYIKLHNLMLIAIIRKMLVATKIKNVFSMSKEQLLLSIDKGKEEEKEETVPDVKEEKEKKSKKKEEKKQPKKEEKSVFDKIVSKKKIGKRAESKKEKAVSKAKPKKERTDKKKDKINIKKAEKKENSDSSPKNILKGVCFSGEGEVEAPVHVIKSVKEYKPSFKDSIIVTKTLNPDLVMIMPSIAGMIAENGGKLSHLAVVARERNFPLIGQVENATNVLKKAKTVRMLVKEGKVIIIK